MITTLTKPHHDQSPALKIENHQLGYFPNRENIDSKVIEGWLISRSPATRRTYTGIIRQFLNHVGKAIRDIDYSDVAGFKLYLESEKYALNTIKSKLSCVKSLLSHCQKIGYTIVNVGAVLKCTKPARRVLERSLEISTLIEFIDQIDNLRDKAIVAIATYCGLRISEISNLQWQNIVSLNGEKMFNVYGKGGKTRLVPIPNQVLPLLENLKLGSNSEFIFVSTSNRSKGQKISTTSIHRLFKKLVSNFEKISENPSMHWLRHTYATFLSDKVPLTELMTLLGHANLNTTQQYIRPSIPTNMSELFASGK